MRQTATAALGLWVMLTAGACGDSTSEQSVFVEVASGRSGEIVWKLLVEEVDDQLNLCVDSSETSDPACVLTTAIDGTIDTPRLHFARIIMAENPGPTSPEYVAGDVPSNVAYLEATLSDDSIRTLPVYRLSQGFGIFLGVFENPAPDQSAFAVMKLVAYDADSDVIASSDTSP